jgi:hypothetical protein
MLKPGLYRRRWPACGPFSCSAGASDGISAAPSTSNTGHWIAIVGILAGSWLVRSLERLAGRQSATQKLMKLPGGQATINKDTYEGGWRSVQLHMPSLPECDFQLKNWYIVRLSKTSLASRVTCAENDD